jgi:hypothetical protein
VKLWVRAADAVPDDGSEVDVITPGGAQQRLVYESGLWWLPDRSMYVYFTPEFWHADV